MPATETTPDAIPTTWTGRNLVLAIRGAHRDDVHQYIDHLDALRRDQANRYETILRDVLSKLDSRPDQYGVFDRDRQEIRAALAATPPAR